MQTDTYKKTIKKYTTVYYIVQIIIKAERQESTKFKNTFFLKSILGLKKIRQRNECFLFRAIFIQTYLLLLLLLIIFIFVVNRTII